MRGDGDPGSVEVGHGRRENHGGGGGVVQPTEAPAQLQCRHLPGRAGRLGVGEGGRREVEDGVVGG